MATIWNIDGARSSAAFVVKHLMVTSVRGELRQLEGTVQYDAASPEATRIDARIGAASIQTGDAQRDAYLRSPDFLNVERFPWLTFVSTSTAKKGRGLVIRGALTIRGVAREVTLEVEREPEGATRLEASAKARLKRSDFGLTFGAALEAGGLLVGDELKLALDVALSKAS